MENTTDGDNRSRHRRTNISPFLANAGTPRTGEDQLPGYYCEQQQMWVVDTAQGTQPIINEQALSQLLTKTRAHEEEDDDSYLALELMTKTYLQIESDDDTQPSGYNNLLQLVTKTALTQEVDDNYLAAQLLELVTKTKVQQEADDDAIQSFGFHC
ncbi:hypothetical protein [Stutzerimonas stutzeri]|uniref:hypothetical protein n=1 Tax=Stutzerimonas stutzeri TaxID=316 RepID=UPI0021598166|nr:hypothetical protein [Stutzerimonas stutzeri]